MVSSKVLSLNQLGRLLRRPVDRTKFSFWTGIVVVVSGAGPVFFPSFSMFGASLGMSQGFKMLGVQQPK
jgi:hypothetical protein